MSLTLISFAQTADTTLSTDKSIRNKVLSDIQDNLDKKTKNMTDAEQRYQFLTELRRRSIMN